MAPCRRCRTSLFVRLKLTERTKRAPSRVVYGSCLFAAQEDVAPSCLPLPPMDSAREDRSKIRCV